MTKYCAGCEKTHDWHSWRGSGEPLVWRCNRHFNETVREYIPERIKEDRKRYKRDLLQPHREGVPSREFIEAYPKQAAQIFSKKERSTAKNVWSDV